MEDHDRRTAPLVAYAALVCGAVAACLLLLAGPAQAGSADPDGGTAEGLPLDRVGERVAETTREVGRGTSDLVHQASAPAAPLAPVAEGAAEEVATTTERLADGVETVTREVDEVVDEPAEPPADPPAEEPADPPAEEPGAGLSAAGAQVERADRPLRAATGRADVPAKPDPEPAPRGVRAPRSKPVAPPAPAPMLLTSSPAGAPAPAAVPEPGSLQLVAGCDDCAATGASSGDPLLVLGLPSQDVTTPRIADSVSRDAVGGGPATVFRRPDISPD